MTKIGSLEVICGCMFSGKTSELIRRLDRARFAKYRIQAFKSHHDIRYGGRGLRTHSGASFPAISVPNSSSRELKRILDPDQDMIAIDEVQFFDEGVVDLSEQLANNGVTVIVAGLDLDFRGEPFPGPMLAKHYPSPITALMCKADRLDKLVAACTVCGQDATRSQRLINGEPAKWNELIMVVGALDVYEARCRLHHYVEEPKTLGK